MPASVPIEKESAWRHPDFMPPLATFFTVPAGYDVAAHGNATIAPGSIEVYTATAWDHVVAARNGQPRDLAADMSRANESYGRHCSPHRPSAAIFTGTLRRADPPVGRGVMPYGSVPFAAAGRAMEE